MSRIAYFDAFNGASGDMIVGALLAAGADLAQLRTDLAKLGLDEVTIDARPVLRGGLAGTKFDVTVRGHHEGPAELHAHAHNHKHEHDREHEHDHDREHEHDREHDHGHHQHDHGHRTLADVEARLAGLPAGPREQALAIFRRLAAAEAQVHGTTINAIHFHEVGQDDAIADIAAAVLCLAQLGVTEVQASPLPLGAGLVRCAHGVMPVPVPAVAELLRGVPTVDNGERGELVTPTGAAILVTLATRFGPPPAWTTDATGYGAGTRQGRQVPNLLRVMLGTPAAEPEAELLELAANIDDLNPQLYGPLTEQLLAAGALDVTLTPTLMKKGRPGIVLAALIPAAQLDALATLIFTETTTLGLRHHPVSRRVLDRAAHTVTTPWGPVGVKVAALNGRPVNVSPEFEDCRRVAEAAGQPIKEVWQAALVAARCAGLAGEPHRA